MKDKPDIVARLRAYTQHNRPVLASDLKEAADELQTRQHLVDQFARLLRHLFEGVHEAVGSTTVPPINTQTAVELVGMVRALRHDRDALTPADMPEAVEVPPAVTPRTERLDEFERRLALLESSVRTTMRRFSLAADAINAPGSEWAKLTRLSDALRGKE